MRVLKTIGRIRAEHGAGMGEYGITVGLIAVLSIGAILALGERVEKTFLDVAATVSEPVVEVEVVEQGPSEAVVNLPVEFSDPLSPEGFRFIAQSYGSDGVGFVIGSHQTPVQRGGNGEAVTHFLQEGNSVIVVRYGETFNTGFDEMTGGHEAWVVCGNGVGSVDLPNTLVNEYGVRVGAASNGVPFSLISGQVYTCQLRITEADGGNEGY